MNLGATLTKQVGPLPLGVWLLVGGGGLFIAYRSSKAAAPDAEAVAPAGVALPQGGGYDAPTSWDGAPVVLSPVIQNEPPRVPVNNDLPTFEPEPIYQPQPITLPVAPPRVPAKKPAPKPVAKKPAPKPVAKKPAPKPVAKKRTHTVRSGDTLSGISGAKWPALYALNKGTIEAAAKRHGKSSSSGGHWIYPGTVLVLP